MIGVNAESEARWSAALSDQCRKMVFCQTNKQTEEKKKKKESKPNYTNLSKKHFQKYLLALSGVESFRRSTRGVLF